MWVSLFPLANNVIWKTGKNSIWSKDCGYLLLSIISTLQKEGDSTDDLSFHLILFFSSYLKTSPKMNALEDSIFLFHFCKG